MQIWIWTPNWTSGPRWINADTGACWNHPSCRRCPIPLRPCFAYEMVWMEQVREVSTFRYSWAIAKTLSCQIGCWTSCLRRESRMESSL
eukprot:g28263.t1